MAPFHLLQPKSSLRICRLRFIIARTRCCLSLNDNGSPNQLNKESIEEETSIGAVEPIVEENPEKKHDLVSKATFIKKEIASYGVLNKLRTLTDLFRDDQSATTTEIKGSKSEPTIAEIILSCAKHSDIQSECLSSHSNDPLQSEPAIDSHDTNPNESTPNKQECQNVKKGEEVDNSSPSNSAQKVPDLKDRHTNKPRSFTAFTQQQPMTQNSNEPRTEDADKLSVISGLIDFMRLTEDRPKPSIPSSKADVVKDNSFDVNSQKSKPTKETNFSGEESEENKVLIRFMRRTVTETHIWQRFISFGEISKVVIPYTEGPLLKSGYVYFKTKEGFKNALTKTVLLLAGGVVSVESANSKEKKPVKKTPIPSLIGDPDTPTALVKNPTRTIKIESLSSEISSHHIEEALEFCETNVSGYFMGSSDSVAYVEFETEMGKERALAKQSINVMGRHLVMLRIDSPRTTVVKITGRIESKLKTILDECRSLGKVGASFSRAPCMLDVHFELDEWPNMLKIINRLNGREIDGVRVQAESAPVFPPDVLIALWQDPDERKHLKTTMQILLHKLGRKSIDTSQLAVLENAFVDNI